MAVRGALPQALSKPRSLPQRSEAQNLEILSNQGRLQPEDYSNESKGFYRHSKQCSQQVPDEQEQFSGHGQTILQPRLHSLSSSIYRV